MANFSDSDVIIGLLADESLAHLFPGATAHKCDKCRSTIFVTNEVFDAASMLALTRGKKLHVSCDKCGATCLDQANRGERTAACRLQDADMLEGALEKRRQEKLEMN